MVLYRIPPLTSILRIWMITLPQLLSSRKDRENRIMEQMIAAKKTDLTISQNILGILRFLCISLNFLSSEKQSPPMGRV